MTDPRVTLRGVDFAYLEAGPANGPLALLLHGFPDHAPTWEQLLVELGAAGYHAVAPWTRGYAPTSLAPDGNYQIGGLALDALAFADHFAGDRDDAVLIGHDWGAITGYTAAGHRPDRFAKLVTMAVPHSMSVATHFLDNPRQLMRSWYTFFFQTPFAEHAVSVNDFAFIDFLWSYWSPGFTPEPSFMRALKDTFAAPGCIDAAIAYYRAMLGGAPGEEALNEVQSAANGAIPVPTLFLHGADDGCMLPEMIVREEMEPYFPNGFTFELVPGTGHFLHLENPATVNGHILKFLTS